MLYNKILEIKNHISEISKISSFLEEFAEKFVVNPKIIFEINLVLEELLTNTINYGYDDEKEHTMEIDFDVKDMFLECAIIDDGKEFNPLEKENPDLEMDLDDMPIGGLGIFFVKKKVDAISYKRLNGKNILKFRKKIGDK